MSGSFGHQVTIDGRNGKGGISAAKGGLWGQFFHFITQWNMLRKILGNFEGVQKPIQSGMKGACLVLLATK